jgi:hypothetical protein
MVEGPSGTSGYAQIAIPKDIISNVKDLKVQLDDKQIEYQIDSSNDSWLVNFTYNHSIHIVKVSLGSGSIGILQPLLYVIIGVIISISLIVILTLKKRLRYFSTNTGV